jgi:hypothetical protein
MFYIRNWEAIQPSVAAEEAKGLKYVTSVTILPKAGPAKSV